MSDTIPSTRRIGLVAIALVALVAGAGLVSAAASGTIAVDDPDNQTVAVDVNSTNIGDDTVTSADLTISLETADGTVADEQTITSVSAPSSETVTFSMDTLAADEYTVVANSSDSTNVGVEIAETRLTETMTVDVEDAGNETLVVDAGFASASDATASVTVADGTGTELFTDSIAYTAADHDDDMATVTAEYNESDGLVAMTDGTVTVEYAPASVADTAYATVDDGSSSLFGGTIAGQDTEVAVGGLLVLGLGGYYSRREGWI